MSILENVYQQYITSNSAASEQHDYPTLPRNQAGHAHAHDGADIAMGLYEDDYHMFQDDMMMEEGSPHDRSGGGSFVDTAPPYSPPSTFFPAPSDIPYPHDLLSTHDSTMYDLPHPYNVEFPPDPNLLLERHDPELQVIDQYLNSEDAQLPPAGQASDLLDWGHDPVTGGVHILCGQCRTWIPSNCKTLESARSNFQQHYALKRCDKRRTARIRGGLDPETQPFDTQLAPLPQLPPPPLWPNHLRQAPPTELRTCFGILLEWPDKDTFELTYLHQRHHYDDVDGSRYCLPWRRTFWDEQTKQWTIRSRNCDFQYYGTSTCCNQCSKVNKVVAEKYDSLVGDNSKYTNTMLSNFANLRSRISEMSEQVREADMKNLNLKRDLERAKLKLQLHEGILELLKDNPHLPRLPQLLQAAEKQGLGLCKLSERLVNGIQGDYQAKQFDKRDLDLALLTLRLGGYRLLYAFSQEFSLPSLRTLMHKHIRLDVEPCLGIASVANIIREIQKLVIDPATPEQKSHRCSVGCKVALNEVSLNARMCDVKSGDECAFGGVCACEGNFSAEDLKITTLDEVLDIADRIFGTATKEPDLHYASFATVVGLHFLAKEDYRAIPFIVEPCCGTKDSEKFKYLIATLIAVWDKLEADHTGLDFFGWFWSIATDGDSSRRKGGFEALMAEALDPMSPLALKMGSLLGMDWTTGPHLITLNFDWKHIIKRFSTTIRSKEGMFICGKNITASLIARYMHRIKIPALKIAALLEPKDAMNVPCAVELVQTLEAISHIPQDQLDPVERQDICAITVFSELFGSFVKAYTEYESDLTQQMTMLSKYAHLAAYLYQTDKARFMPNPLYFDLVCCVKNAFFCLGKQQLLDEDQLYLLFLLGTDGIEDLFAGACMSGGHRPNFDYGELQRLLSSGMDIMRILAEHPEWYSGHRRRSTKRGEHVDNIRPLMWKGNARAGDINIPIAWLRGSQQALWVIKTYLKHDVGWMIFFANANILRPCGKYVGVKVSPVASIFATASGTAGDDKTQDRSMQEDGETSHVSHILSELPDVIREAALHEREQLLNSCAATPILGPELDLDVDEVEDDPAGALGDPDDDSEPLPLDQSMITDDLVALADQSAVLPPPGPRRKNYVWVKTRWVHIATIVRVLFNENSHSKQSKDHLLRIRAYAGPEVAEHIVSVRQPDQLYPGQPLATIIRCNNAAYLAIVTASKLFKDGVAQFSVARSELSIPSNKIEVRAQINTIIAHEAASEDSPECTWKWGKTVAQIRPVKATPTAQDLSYLLIPGAVLTDVPVSRCNGDKWLLLHTFLEITKEYIWDRIKSQSLLGQTASCGLSNDFPYKWADGFGPSFVVADYTPPKDQALQRCQQCAVMVDDKLRMQHMAQHILPGQCGIVEEVPSGGTLFSYRNRDNCGFCGASPSCEIKLQKVGSTIKMVEGRCPNFYAPRSWLDANKSQAVLWTTNVPIVCRICDDKPVNSTPRVAIWKYNFDAHVRNCHPEYAVPGWPSCDRRHHDLPSQPGFAPPLEMAKELNFGKDEELRMKVATSIPWTSLQPSAASRTTQPSVPTPHPVPEPRVAGPSCPAKKARR